MVAFRHAGECVPLSGAVWVKATVGEQEVAALDSAVRPRSAVASTMANSAKFMMRRLTAKPWLHTGLPPNTLTASDCHEIAPPANHLLPTAQHNRHSTCN